MATLPSYFTSLERNTTPVVSAVLASSTKQTSPPSAPASFKAHLLSVVNVCTSSMMATTSSVPKYPSWFLSYFFRRSFTVRDRKPSVSVRLKECWSRGGSSSAIMATLSTSTSGVPCASRSDDSSGSTRAHAATERGRVADPVRPRGDDEIAEFSNKDILCVVPSVWRILMRLSLVIRTTRSERRGAQITPAAPSVESAGLDGDQSL